MDSALLFFGASHQPLRMCCGLISMLSKWVYYSPLDFVFCLHRDSGSSRGETLAINLSCLSWACVQLCSGARPSRSRGIRLSFSKISYGHHSSLILLFSFWPGSCLSVIFLKNHHWFFFLTNYPRDRALSHQVFSVRSNNNCTLNGLSQRPWDKSNRDSVLKVEPFVELSIPCLLLQWLQGHYFHSCPGCEVAGFPGWETSDNSRLS